MSNVTHHLCIFETSVVILGQEMPSYLSKFSKQMFHQDRWPFVACAYCPPVYFRSRAASIFGSYEQTLLCRMTCPVVRNKGLGKSTAMLVHIVKLSRCS